MTPLLRLTPPLDPEMMLVDHFYAADHADEWESIQWDQESQRVAQFNRIQEMSRESAH